jgi:hypothetical protein
MSVLDTSNDAKLSNHDVVSTSPAASRLPEASRNATSPVHVTVHAAPAVWCTVMIIQKDGFQA